MKSVFIINGGQKFAHAKGRFNRTITGITESLFDEHPYYRATTTHTDK